MPGNLVAFACRLAFKAGFRGHLAFDAKTQLINHYEKTLGAKRAGRGSRMILDEPASNRLIEQCFGKEDRWPT